MQSISILKRGNQTSPAVPSCGRLNFKWRLYHAASSTGFSKKENEVSTKSNVKLKHKVCLKEDQFVEFEVDIDTNSSDKSKGWIWPFLSGVLQKVATTGIVGGVVYASSHYSNQLAQITDYLFK